MVICLVIQQKIKMKQVIFKETGLPESVLILEEVDIPVPRAHETLVRITARNINPSDIM